MPVLNTTNHKTIEFQNGYLAIVAEAFLTDRKATGKAAGTIVYYREHLNTFIKYCDTQAIQHVHEPTPDVIRRYLLARAEGHNAGGVHGSYHAIRTFLNWVEFEEILPDEWRNPIRKVKPPKVPEQILEPITLQDVNAILNACKRGRYIERDRAMFLVLDTGIRAGELCNLNVSAVDLGGGVVAIRKSKSAKPRLACLAARSSK